MIGGHDSAWLTVGNWSIAQGTFFTTDDVSRVTKVAVLGSTVAANLFPAGGAVGSTIIVKSVPFRVLGVLAAKGQTGFGRDQDDVVIVPITTHQETADRADVDQHHPDVGHRPRTRWPA